MKSSELVRLVKKDGWFAVRQTGRHMIWNMLLKKGKLFVLIMAAMK